MQLATARPPVEARWKGEKWEDCLTLLRGKHWEIICVTQHSSFGEKHREMNKMEPVSSVFVEENELISSGVYGIIIIITVIIIFASSRDIPLHWMLEMIWLIC